MPLLPPSCVVPLHSDSYTHCALNLSPQLCHGLVPPEVAKQTTCSPLEKRLFSRSQLSQRQICPDSQVTTFASSWTPVLSTHTHAPNIRNPCWLPCKTYPPASTHPCQLPPGHTTSRVSLEDGNGPNCICLPVYPGTPQPNLVYLSRSPGVDPSLQE